MPSPEAWRAAGSYFAHAGHRHFVRRGGRGAPILLIHGYPTNSWDWRRIWDSLTAHYSVIAPDMLGMGFSDKPRHHRYGVFDRVTYRDRLVEPLIEGVVPMRLINGSRDPNSGAHMARRYRELVRNPDVIDLPEIGHWPQIEAPGEVAAAIHEFLEP